MKNILIIVAIILFLGGSIGIFNLLQNKNESANPLSQLDNAAVSTTSKNSTSRYIEFTDSTLVQTADKRRVLFFYANWCSTCRPADAGFRENENKIPEDVVVVRINYNDTDTDNEEKELAQKYGITYQHTFVQIDSEGNQIAKWNGGGIDELLANIK